jgi:hypothetical protein
VTEDGRPIGVIPAHAPLRGGVARLTGRLNEGPGGFQVGRGVDGNRGGGDA